MRVFAIFYPGFLDLILLPLLLRDPAYPGITVQYNEPGHLRPDITKLRLRDVDTDIQERAWVQMNQPSRRGLRARATPRPWKGALRSRGAAPRKG